MKKRILVDAHIFDKERQGLTTYIKGLYNELQQKYNAYYDIYLFADNIELLKREFPRIPSENLIKINALSSGKRLTYQVYNIIKEYNIDYAHFQQIAPLFKNCRYIVTIHDLLFNDFPDKFSLFYRLSRNFLFKNALNQADIALTVSNYSKEAIKQHYNIDNVTVTPNAISDSFKVAYDKAIVQVQVKQKHGLENYLLFVSRIENRKNHVLLLKAYRKLGLYKQGIHLVFVGRNDIPVSELDHELSLLTKEEKQYFHWMQFVDDNELIQLYQAASLFVYPSLAEGFGIPPIESAALGVNTISSNLTAMGDFVFLEDNLFDPNDFDGFCEVLKRNVFTPPSGEVLEKRKKIVHAKYSWTNAANILHEEIQKNIDK